MKQHALRDSGKSGETPKKAPADSAATPARSSLMAPYSFAGMNVFPFPGATVSGEVVNPMPPIDRGPVILMPSIALGYEVKGGPKGTPVFIGKDGATFELQTLVNTISYSVDPNGHEKAITFSTSVPGLPRTSVSVGVEGDTVTWSTQTEVATFGDGKSNYSGSIQLTFRLKIVRKGPKTVPEPVPEPIPVLDPEQRPTTFPPWVTELGEILLKALLKAAYFVALIVMIVLALLALSLA